MKPATIGALAAAGLLIAGLVIGLAPAHSSSGADCGTPFASKVADLRTESSYARLGSAVNGSGGDLGYGDAAAECDGKLNSTRPVAILLTVVGGVGTVGGVLAATGGPRTQAPPQVG